MTHTYTANHLHFVFSTKERRDIILPELQPKLWAYIAGTARKLDIIPIAVGGMSNHVHMLLTLKPTMRPAEAIQKLKANSSRWMGEHNRNFEWQKGYAAFSVSPSQVSAVKSYVLRQEEQHRHRSFEEEFWALLKKSGITHDPDDVFTASFRLPTKVTSESSTLGGASFIL
jgi:REP element-mobilizing transposase RayT